MVTFLGESEVSLDNRGRFLLPANIRKQIPEELGRKFVINRGFEPCITIYTMDVWQVVHDWVSRLNDFDDEERIFKRLFLNGASEVDMDSADRLLIPKNMMEYAGIVKDAVLTPQGNKLELWDKNTYYDHLKQHAANFSNMAKKIGNPFQQR
jgi:MraZ protein